VRFSTTRADLSIGSASVHVLNDGRYALRARARSEQGGSEVDVSLVIDPANGAYFPGAALGSGEAVSGYVVPALRADATGSICVDGRCEQYDRAQAYHDHNWGVWRGVTWEWGAARAGTHTLLYGRVQPADSNVAMQPLFVYVTDSLGFVALFRPKTISYLDGRTLEVGGRTLRVPSSATMFDARGDDTLRVELTIEDATATDKLALTKRYFVQMKGTMKISGRVNGKPLSGSGAGFFETYR
jgi:hypothetical protein